MTENTAAVETVEDDQVEDETSEDLTPFDTEGLDPESRNPIDRFFALVKPLYNQSIELASQYAALTADSSDAVKTFLESTTDPDVLEAKRKLDEYRAAIAQIEETLNALAQDHIAKTVGNGKSPDDIRKEFQNVNAAINDLAYPARDMFGMMGYVSQHTPEVKEGKKRSRTVWESTGTPEGDDLMKILNRPSLSASTSGSASTGEGKKIREWWESNAEAINVPYQKQGKLPNAVKEAYAKANG